MKQLACYIFFLTLMGCSNVESNDSGNISKEKNIEIKEYIIKQNKDGKIIDLKKKYGTNFRGLKLASVNLSGVDLSGTDLSGSSFARVNFKNANMDGVNISGSLLQESDFSGVKFQNLHLKDLNF